MCIGFAEHVALNFHVHHHEISTIERVRHDTADERGCKHNGIGAFFIKKFLDGVLVSKIEFLVGAADKVVVAAGLKVIPNGGAHQPVVARNVNFRVLI